MACSAPRWRGARWPWTRWSICWALAICCDAHAATLSGGERQRVAIARRAGHQPQLLLMDEPLSALDAARKAEVLPYLEALPRELAIPILYVSHAQEEVLRLAQHIVQLAHGQVVRQGDAATLFNQLDQGFAAGNATAVLQGQLLAHHVPDHLSALGFAGGQLLLPTTPALASRPLGSAVRLTIAARDVSLSLQPLANTSLLDSLPPPSPACARMAQARCWPPWPWARANCSPTSASARPGNWHWPQGKPCSPTSKAWPWCARPPRPRPQRLPLSSAPCWMPPCPH